MRSMALLRNWYLWAECIETALFVHWSQIWCQSIIRFPKCGWNSLTFCYLILISLKTRLELRNPFDFIPIVLSHIISVYGNFGKWLMPRIESHWVRLWKYRKFGGNWRWLVCMQLINFAFLFCIAFASSQSEFMRAHWKCINRAQHFISRVKLMNNKSPNQIIIEWKKWNVSVFKSMQT